jgi:hypothetical protein
MKQSMLAMSAALALTCVGVPAQATSVYDYKPKEYVTVDGGLAPNKRLSIAANGYRSFHVFLMAEPAQKPIAALPSIDNNAILATGPSAYHAVWSPDSRYVAMHFRKDRHVLTMLLYEIRGGHPHLLDTPSLFAAATKLPDSSDDFDVRSDVTYLTWLSSHDMRAQRTADPGNQSAQTAGKTRALRQDGRRSCRRQHRQSAGAAFHQIFRARHLPSGAGTRLSHPRYEARHVRVTYAV